MDTRSIAIFPKLNFRKNDISPNENDGYSQLFPKISVRIVYLADGVELNALERLVK